VADPELLLLDEPAGGLSGKQLDRLADQIRDFRESMAVVLVEHHMDLVMRVCDHIVVLDFGRVISTGTPEAVQTDPVVTQASPGTSTGGPHDNERKGERCAAPNPCWRSRVFPPTTAPSVPSTTSPCPSRNGNCARSSGPTAPESPPCCVPSRACTRRPPAR